jgi:hypothetical protein
MEDLHRPEYAKVHVPSPENARGTRAARGHSILRKVIDMCTHIRVAAQVTTESEPNYDTVLHPA